MAAETNTIMAADVVAARMADFNLQFTAKLNHLAEILGSTRRIPVIEGTTIQGLKVTGSIASDATPEGELIPLSKYTTTAVPLTTASLVKVRKTTTMEAVLKGGINEVVATTEKAISDVQKKIRGNFFTLLGTGTSTVTGAGLQAALAAGWGKLQVLFEDDAVEPVFFVNPEDVSDYLAKAQITLQKEFGMSYVENFLGLGTLIMSASITKGTYYATAKENIITYYVDMANGQIADAFKLTVDDTGYVGIREYVDGDYARLTELIVCSVNFMPERLDGIVKGTITAVAGE